MTNTFDPISSRYNKVASREMKEVLAPRLRALEESYPAPPPQSAADLRGWRSIDDTPFTQQLDGRIAAATLAPMVGFLMLSLLNFFVPVIELMGLRTLLLENGIRNLGTVLTLGVWLFTWAALHEALRDRTLSRTKLYALTGSIFLVAVILFIPAVYRLMET